MNDLDRIHMYSKLYNKVKKSKKDRTKIKRLRKYLDKKDLPYSEAIATVSGLENFVRLIILDTAEKGVKK